ncbi:hypothetical protein P691DRAFT_757245 [Macrolepiota fuliginosa MF-IS2]|uniref:Uncharacterized protein n=1 Tax=Macrolepiota fuliginosa MF-IS2 TaxID=1400762 RepID=A0A9P5XHJ2_9AGAR|nr:hypothetical protein P691DRAFT_757245 [Macrolepiota fuliginosa MF-IS2]
MGAQPSKRSRDENRGLWTKSKRRLRLGFGFFKPRRGESNGTWRQGGNGVGQWDEREIAPYNLGQDTDMEGLSLAYPVSTDHAPHHSSLNNRRAHEVPDPGRHPQMYQEPPAVPKAEPPQSQSRGRSRSRPQTELHPQPEWTSEQDSRTRHELHRGQIPVLPQHEHRPQFSQPGAVNGHSHNHPNEPRTARHHPHDTDDISNWGQTYTHRHQHHARTNPGREPQPHPQSQHQFQSYLQPQHQSQQAQPFRQPQIHHQPQSRSHRQPPPLPLPQPQSGYQLGPIPPPPPQSQSRSRSQSRPRPQPQTQPFFEPPPRAPRAHSRPRHPPQPQQGHFQSHPQHQPHPLLQVSSQGPPHPRPHSQPRRSPQPHPQQQTQPQQYSQPQPLSRLAQPQLDTNDAHGHGHGRRFFRPGEPGHPAYKPISSEFMQRYGRGQNAVAKPTEHRGHGHTGPVFPPGSANINFAHEPTNGHANGWATNNLINPSSDLRQDGGEYYDRRHGGRAAERRAQEESATGSMMYYRPGDPNHPSVKPISSRFKQRYGAQEQMGRMQDQNFRYD